MSSLAILVADDNAVCRRAVAIALRRRGHRVDTVASGDDALHVLALRRYDVVVLDLDLPVVDGYRVSAVARGHARPPSIVGLASRLAPAEAERCLEAGVEGVVPKPFLPHHLITAVEGSVGAMDRERATA